jgi:hypothetical protein
MRTLDIILDKAGYYICWGCLVFVPGFYASPTLYLVSHPVEVRQAWRKQIRFQLIVKNFEWGIRMAGIRRTVSGVQRGRRRPQTAQTEIAVSPFRGWPPAGHRRVGRNFGKSMATPCHASMTEMGERTRLILNIIDMESTVN